MLIEKNRGQLSIVNAQSAISELKLPIVSDTYITPVLHQQQLIGASYSNSRDMSVNYKEHAMNINRVSQLLGKDFIFNEKELNSRISFRGYSKDRMPIVGPMINAEFYNKNYFDLHHGKKYKKYPDGEYLPGIFLNIAHGSRGLISCFTSAKYIAELMLDKPKILPKRVMDRVHPGRFLIRKLKKQA